MINGLSTDVNNNFVSFNDLALLNMGVHSGGGLNLASAVASTNGYPYTGAPVQLSALGHLSPGSVMTSFPVGAGMRVGEQPEANANCPSTNPSAANFTTSNQQQKQQQKLSVEYLAQLLKDKKSLTSFPNIFLHVERLLEDEISKVRSAVFHVETGAKEDLVLPEPQGNVATVQERVYVPVKDYPDFNFVGRILGPRGMTAKQLEQETGCKIMVRGKGSMRDKKKEDANRGKPNWEHLNDELHVLIQCEDTENRASVKIKRALEEVKILLVPAPEGEDDLKRKQLMELAIMNGTYRPSNQAKAGLPVQQMLCPMSLAQSLRSPSLGAPIYLSPPCRPVPPTFAGAGLTALQSFLPSPAGLDLNSAAAAGLLWQLDPFLSLSATGYPYTSNAGLTAQLLTGDYAASDSQAGAILSQRRILSHAREHPYQRPSTS